MQFNSYIFIMVFMPVMVAFYFLAYRFHISGGGKLVLVLGSIVFYAYSDKNMLFFLGTSILINYFFALLIKWQKWRKIFLPVMINIGFLLYFKYWNFAIANLNACLKTEYTGMDIVLPIGISFLTFQQIAYLVAVYREELENIDFIDYLAYILYFPKLLMGPLAEPVDFITKLNDPKVRSIDWDSIAEGLKIFSLGLLKKVLLADTFAQAVSWGYANIDEATSMDWFLVMLFYTFQIYFDFSGYSDMAVGSSRLFHITLPINFDSPYKAVSIRDFWKRWHISLTKFFTKYIYIPLGGNRKGKTATYVNTMIVFLISGIWHGANWTFIFWGILHGILHVIENIFESIWRKVIEPVRWFVTFMSVNMLWLLFRSDSFGQWILILKKMFSFQSMEISESLIRVFQIPESVLMNHMIFINRLNAEVRGFWMLLFIVISYGICLIPDNNYKKLSEKSAVTMLLSALAMVLGILCLSTESVFVYFNF